MTVGEKADALEQFYPDRLAQRILGMGDVMSLIEKAEQSYSEEEAKRLEQKMRTASFDLEDFLQQLKQVQNMGSLSSLIEMIPGMRNQLKKAGGLPNLDGREFKRIEAIITSMTLKERRSPGLIDGSRRRRIAKGSGTTVHEVNELLNRFKEAQKMMKQFSKMKLPKGLMR
jgi:signal recognition particle subunit SRP54